MDNSEFLSVLSAKLENANKTVIMEKKRQRQQIEGRIENIEAVLLAKKKFQADALEKARFAVDKISALSNETVKGFNLKSRKEEEMVRNLKQQIENDLDTCEREHQDYIEQIIEKQTEKITEIVEQLSKKVKLSSDASEKSLYELNRAISSLEKNLEDEVQQRKIRCRQIEEDISTEVLKFNQMIDKQRQRREMSEQKIQNMMQQIRNKVASQIESVSAKRKKNNAALLKLIEGACQRLQQKLQIVI